MFWFHVAVLFFQMKESQVQEKVEETGLLQAELHMLETGKVRLSLLEEKLADVLHFLHELRDLVGESWNFGLKLRDVGFIIWNTVFFRDYNSQYFA